MWAGVNTLDMWQLIRLILIGKDASWGISGGEGLPAFLMTFGLPATVAFYGGLLTISRRLWEDRRTRIMALGVVSVTIAFAVDTTYFYPPNVMNVYIISTLAWTLTRTRTGTRRGAGVQAHSVSTADERTTVGRRERTRRVTV